jgi:hypothetical protein
MVYLLSQTYINKAEWNGLVISSLYKYNTELSLISSLYNSLSPLSIYPLPPAKYQPPSVSPLAEV